MNKIIQDRFYNLIVDKTCPICQDDSITIDNYFITKNCGHLFHKECITTYLNTTKQCPVCKVDQINEENGWVLFSQLMETKQYKEYNKIAEYLAFDQECDKCNCSSCEGCSNNPFRSLFEAFISGSRRNFPVSMVQTLSAPPPVPPRDDGQLSVRYVDLSDTNPLNHSHKKCDCKCHKIDFVKLLSKCNVSDDFIDAMSDTIGWGEICKYHKISEDFITKYLDKIEWSSILINKNFTTELLEKYIENIDNTTLSSAKILTEEIIRNNLHKVDWMALCKHKKLSNEFVKDFKDKVCFITLISNNNIDLTFISNLHVDFKS
jgi:hypothetical protein